MKREEGSRKWDGGRWRAGFPWQRLMASRKVRRVRQGEKRKGGRRRAERRPQARVRLPQPLAKARESDPGARGGRARGFGNRAGRPAESGGGAQGLVTTGRPRSIRAGAGRPSGAAAKSLSPHRQRLPRRVSGGGPEKVRVSDSLSAADLWRTFLDLAQSRQAAKKRAERKTEEARRGRMLKEVYSRFQTIERGFFREWLAPFGCRGFFFAAKLP